MRGVDAIVGDVGNRRDGCDRDGWAEVDGGCVEIEGFSLGADGGKWAVDSM